MVDFIKTEVLKLTFTDSIKKIIAKHSSENAYHFLFAIALEIIMLDLKFLKIISEDGYYCESEVTIYS